MTPTIAELAVSPEEFARAVAEMRASPFGYTLATIRQEISDAVAACQVHANGERMAYLTNEVEFWMEELEKWEAANKVAKLNDWQPVGAKE